MRLTIKSKLIATFSTVILLSGVSMFVAVQNLAELNETMDHLVTSRAAATLNLSQMETLTSDIGSQTRQMILSTDPAEMEVIAGSLAQTNAELARLSEQVRSRLTTDAGRGHLDDFTRRWDAYWRQNLHLQELTMRNTDLEAMRVSANEGVTAIAAVEEAAQASVKIFGDASQRGEIGATENYQIAQEIRADVSDLFRQHLAVLLAGNDPALQGSAVEAYAGEANRLEAQIGTLLASTQGQQRASVVAL